MEQHALNVNLVVEQDGRAMLEAIRRIESGESPQPDLILLDLNLPLHDGMSVLARLRSSTTCGQVPIIIVSSSDAPSDRETSHRLKASAYFRKPADYDEFMLLGELVKRILSQ